MQPDAFNKLAGSDATLDAADMRRALDAATPESRMKLAPGSQRTRITRQPPSTSSTRRTARREKLALDRGQLPAGKPLHVTVVCTGNSRRSILGSSMGNLAAAYSGMPEIRFHSGGTAPTAFNPRTAAALKAIGFEVGPHRPGGPARRVENGKSRLSDRVGRRVRDPGILEALWRREQSAGRLRGPDGVQRSR